MAGALQKIATGARSLLTGLGMTMGELWRTLVRRKAVTLQYPHEKPELSAAYRSAIQLIRFEDTGTHDCVACLACQQICPSFCIAIDGEKVEGLKKQRATEFTMDFALCSLCGLCIDVCPTTTLEYSKLYDQAGYTRDWEMDLLEPFREDEERFREEQRAREAEAAAEKARAAEAAKAAKAAKAAAAAGGEGEA
ncbi:MAG: 4Fe-4S dicluster domain-containing protein [Deltaproteobacteria bacterium]|nr:4Fe-4S dicluster domain-containing protein [Deltaproteobacteria bacterium]